MATEYVFMTHGEYRFPDLGRYLIFFPKLLSSVEESVRRPSRIWICDKYLIYLFEEPETPLFLMAFLLPLTRVLNLFKSGSCSCNSTQSLRDHCGISIPFSTKFNAQTWTIGWQLIQSGFLHGLVTMILDKASALIPGIGF